MVLELHGAPAQTATLGPAHWYRLKDGELFGPNNRLLLAYHDGYWVHDGRRFTSVVCRGPAMCHFEHGSARRNDVEGPFQTLMLASAVLWGDHLSLARYEAERKRWVLLHTGNTFAAVVWQPSHGGPARR
jgi:hypothetical protein